MSWSPISLAVPQYSDANGEPYSGAVLKAYASGTSTPISMATDATGGTTVGSVALNASGYPAVSGNVIIPHVSANYKLVLYPTQAAADANSGALWSVDALIPSTTNLAASTGSSLVGHIATGTGAVATTVQSKLRETSSAQDRGVVGNGVADDTATLGAVAVFPCFLPPATYNITADIAGTGKQFYGVGGVKFTNNFRIQTSTAYGIQALENNVGFNTGAPTLTDKNVAVGTRALRSNTTGYHNTAVGDEALYTNTTGNQNTAIGLNTLFYNTGNMNTALGVSALLNNTTGSHNTAIGRAAGFANTTGDYNVYVGRNAGTDATTAINNTVVGGAACWELTTGSSNVAIGWQASYSLKTGTENSALGVNALTLADAGSRNAAFGYYAAYATTVNDIVAVGHSALRSNTTGTFNTAVGTSALYTNTTGTLNTAVGYRALIVSTGTDNTAVGANSMRFNVGGGGNVAVGGTALYTNTSGSKNIALGSEALYTNATSDQSTAVGYQSLKASTGANNTAIGYRAGYAVVAETNVTCLGANAAVTGSNQVQLGDSATTAYAYGAVQNRSDLRDKADVRDTRLGLSFITALRPVDFKWAYREDAGRARKRFHHGLIAQEVKAAISSSGIDFGGFQDHSIEGGQDVMSLGYTEFIAPLIKAVQELAARVIELEQEKAT